MARFVRARDAVDPAAERPQLIDFFLPKLGEWVARSGERLRAYTAHDRLYGLGGEGSERTTQWRVAAVKAAFAGGRVQVDRPWVTEPGMWLHEDFGDGPVIEGAKTTLFCAWLAWSRFRVVLPIRDTTAQRVFAARNITLRRLGGAPTSVLADSVKTVTLDHVAGVPVRNLQMVAWARHHG